MKYAIELYFDKETEQRLYHLTKRVADEELSKPQIINALVKGLLETQERQNNGTPILNLLAKEKRQTENAIKNIMTAIEKGVITNTTTKRLKELEEQQENLERQILIERSKTAVKLSESDMREFYAQALELEPQMLINYLIKEIVLFDDKIEIHYNSPIKISPDDSLGFSFYSKTIQINAVQNVIITMMI